MQIEMFHTRLGGAVRKPGVLGQRGEMSINDPRQIRRTLPITHGRQTALMLYGIATYPDTVYRGAGHCNSRCA